MSGIAGNKTGGTDLLGQGQQSFYKSGNASLVYGNLPNSADWSKLLRLTSGKDLHSKLVRALLLNHSQGAVRHRRSVGKSEAIAMLHYASLFLIITLVAALLGFWGIAGIAAQIAKILFAVFLALFCVTLLFGYAVI